MLKGCAVATPRAAAAPDEVRAAGWDLRAVRAVPFAVVCTLVAAAGHTAASGEAVPVLSLALGFVAVCALAALLGGRERSLTAIAGGLVAGQLALHMVFRAVQGAAASAPDAASIHAGMANMSPASHGEGISLIGIAGRLLCGDHVIGGAPALLWGTNPELSASPAAQDPSGFALIPVLSWWDTSVLGVSPTMLAGHLVAATAAGWWLRRGEAALWRLIRLAASAVQLYRSPLRTVLAVAEMLLRGLLGTRPVRPVRAYGAERGGWRLPVPAALRHSVIRRGPPAVASAI